MSDTTAAEARCTCDQQTAYQGPGTHLAGCPFNGSQYAVAYPAPSSWDGKTFKLNTDGTITVDGTRYRLVPV